MQTTELPGSPLKIRTEKHSVDTYHYKRDPISLDATCV